MTPIARRDFENVNCVQFVHSGSHDCFQLEETVEVQDDLGSPQLDRGRWIDHRAADRSRSCPSELSAQGRPSRNWPPGLPGSGELETRPGRSSKNFLGQVFWRESLKKMFLSQVCLTRWKATDQRNDQLIDKTAKSDPVASEAPFGTSTMTFASRTPSRLIIQRMLLHKGLD